MDNNQKKWHEIHTKNMKEREGTRKERLLRRKIGLEITRSKAATRVPVKVPQNMSLFENYDVCIGFIEEVKRYVFVENSFVFLDFSQCTKISAEMCVVLAAEIDRCNKIVPDSVFGAYPTDQDVYFMLNELGFFHLLGIKSSKPQFDNANEVDVVRLQSGSDNPVNLMRGIKGLFFSSNEPKSTFSNKIYRALTEAMANAVEHAYPDWFVDKNKGTCVARWWRAGFRVNDDRTIYMVLYDQGAGIPNTLQLNWNEKLLELAARLSRDPYDDEKLVLSMEKGRTSTRISGRGQGSYDMQQLIRESVDGALSIFSYQGKYEYFNDGSWVQEDLNLCLNGTLVVWKVCLNKAEED